MSGENSDVTVPRMSEAMPAQSMRWWALGRGDVNAAIMQIGFNVAQIGICVSLLLPLGVSAEFTVTYLLPGFALGFIVGSIGLAYLAVQLGKKQHRANVTVHAYGNNTAAIVLYTLAIIVPVFLQTRNLILAWEMAAAAVIWTGIIKLLVAPFAEIIRRVIPMPAIMTVFGAAMYSYLPMMLLQRIFDNAIVGIVALTIVAAGVIANVPITRWKIPPILAAWIIPLSIAVTIGYVNPAWHKVTFVLPLVPSLGPLSVLLNAVPYFSIIVPMAIYQVFQDIATVEAGIAAGDEYDARWILLSDGLGTVVSGLAGSVITPCIYAVHPAYKAMGARVGYQLWASVVFLLVVVSGLLLFVTELFPWPIIASMIVFVGIRVGQVIFYRVPKKYYGTVLLGLVIPAGAIVMNAVNSVLPSFGLSAATPTVATILDRTIQWSSIQGLGNGFLLLVLVASALLTELIDRKFSKAALWCLIGALFSWFGLVSSPVFGWAAAPNYAAGWIVAAIILFSARWWSGEKQRQT